MLWLSAQQIADAAARGTLPGLPVTLSGVKRFADAGGWDATPLARPRAGRGGGVEYHIDLLPVAARARWLAQLLDLKADDFRPDLGDGPHSDTRDARAVLVRLAAKFARATGLAQSVADVQFCLLINEQAIDLPDWITAVVRSLSARTLARWRKCAGAVEIGRPKGSGVLDRAHDGAVRAYCLAAIAKQPFLKAKHLRALVADQFGQELDVIDPETGEIFTRPLPSLRMFQIALRDWKITHKNELMRITNPDGYRNSVEFTATGSQRAEALNEWWQIDASPADVMLKGRRHSIYMAVDVYSRRAVVLATPTPRAEGVGLLIRKCLMAWGVPQMIYSDNGSDFVAHRTQRLFAALGIELQRSAPFEPKSKGIVERTIGTFQRDCAILPGFIGHSVADRKIIEGRKAFNQRLGAKAEDTFDVSMDLHEFQSWCDDWAENIYGNTRHSSINRTPNDMAALWGGELRRIEDEAALDLLLAPIANNGGKRRVTKQGIRIDGSRYLPMGIMPGTDVLVRHDPADQGRVFCFDLEDDSFLGEAICPDLAGIHPAEVVAQAKAIQKAFENEKLAEIRQFKRGMNARDMADAIRRGSPVASVVAFPQATTTHSTPALEAAGEATGAARQPEQREKSARLKELQAELKAGSTPPSSTDKPRPKPAPIKPLTPASATPISQQTRQEKFRRALELEAVLKAGQEIPADDQAWLNTYQTLPEYRSSRTMYATYGDTWLNALQATQKGA